MTVLGPENSLDDLFNPSRWDPTHPRGESVYHYTKTSTALRFIVDGTKQILANTARKMNDPLEFGRHGLLGSGGKGLSDEDIPRINR